MIVMCDFTPRVPVYNKYLINQLSKTESCYYLTNPYYDIGINERKSIRITPKVLGNVQNSALVKVFYYFFNWLLLLYTVFFNEVNVVHFQWLVLYEKVSLEKYLIRLLRTKVKVVYTIHNLTPHNTEGKLDKYLKLYREFDLLIVHTKVLKQHLLQVATYSLPKIVVIYHGLLNKECFSTENTDRVSTCEKIVVLQFGFMSYYKGLDILLDAAKIWIENGYSDVEFRAIGKIDAKYLEQIRIKVDDTANFSYNFNFVSEAELIDEIKRAKVLVYPYREITQSGALMLGIASNKRILSSKLPPFVEYLGLCSVFFESENPRSLCEKLSEVLTNQRKNINTNKFEWEKIAQKTLKVYNGLYQ